MTSHVPRIRRRRAMPNLAYLYGLRFRFWLARQRLLPGYLLAYAKWKFWVGCRIVVYWLLPKK